MQRLQYLPEAGAFARASYYFNSINKSIKSTKLRQHKRIEINLESPNIQQVFRDALPELSLQLSNIESLQEILPFRCLKIFDHLELDRIFQAPENKRANEINRLLWKVNARYA